MPAAAAQRLIVAHRSQGDRADPGPCADCARGRRYLDTDLDPYHEVAVSFVVRRQPPPPRPSAFERLGELARGEDLRLHPSTSGRPGVHLRGGREHLGVPEMGGVHRHR